MRVAFYVRVSTERQTQAQTIAQQIERLHQHLAARGEALQAEDIFRDESYSGATLNRPGLGNLNISSLRCLYSTTLERPDTLL